MPQSATREAAHRRALGPGGAVRQASGSAGRVADDRVAGKPVVVASAREAGHRPVPAVLACPKGRRGLSTLCAAVDRSLGLAREAVQPGSRDLVANQVDEPPDRRAAVGQRCRSAQDLHAAQGERVVGDRVVGTRRRDIEQIEPVAGNAHARAIEAADRPDARPRARIRCRARRARPRASRPASAPRAASVCPRSGWMPVGPCRPRGSEAGTP